MIRSVGGVLLALPLLAAPLALAEAPTTALAAQDGSAATPPARVATTPQPSPPAPKNLEALAAPDNTGILGQKIIGPDDKELGLVVDVIVDSEGRPRAAVIDFGGFLGVGSRKIAIDWRLLKFTPSQPGRPVSLELDRAEIQAAPEYKPDAAANQMVGPPAEAPPAPGPGK
jgi:hypothetical protein